MKPSPIIGVTPLWDAERKIVWMLPDYLAGIKAAGGIPIVLPLEMAETDAAYRSFSDGGQAFCLGSPMASRIPVHN